MSLSFEPLLPPSALHGAPYDQYEDTYAYGSPTGHAPAWFQEWEFNSLQHQQHQQAGPSSHLVQHVGTGQLYQAPPNHYVSYELNPPSYTSMHYHHQHHHIQTAMAPPPPAFDGMEYFDFDFDPSPSVASNKPLEQYPAPVAIDPLLDSDSQLRQSTPTPATLVPMPQRPAGFIDPRVVFDRLPKEVHDRICAFLEPKDIVKWSRIRRSAWMYTMRQRSIWFKALQKMCHSNAVPVYFYPTENDVQAYHHYRITTWPDVILWSMRKQPEGCFNHCRRNFDVRESSAEAKLKSVVSNKHVGLATCLVPGGRYLITDDGNRMFIWDLGVGGRMPFKWVNTITHVHPRKNRPMKPTLEVYRSPNAMDFRVVVFFDRLKDRLGRYHIYDVHPEVGGGKENVHLLAAGTEYQKGTLHSFKFNMLATLTANTLKIWNYVEDISVTWTVHNDPPAKLIMFTKTKSIVLVHMHGYTVWDIPGFLFDRKLPVQPSPHPSRVIPPRQYLPVNFTAHMSVDTGAMRGSYSAPVFDKPPVWYEDFGNHPLVFDLVRNRTGKGHCQLRWRYE
ncbi:hypothetical protein NLJ89_g8605 [Agrocybe chaxingu]|uniref:F-box domain-containing protein n=1 Tax=Agrocybe chaxingu TaxID=84603 RepID=A0A9W8JV46_9AGAR|nr:hypothetical protein NLJ89_g8605 [Agrocybe chaxingu]